MARKEASQGRTLTGLVLSAPAVRLTMAIRAQQREVLKPVVVAVAVLVVELDGERPFAPFGDPTLLTSVLFEARPE